MSKELIQDSINRGFCTINHIFTMQNYGVQECLYELFKELDIDNVIEVGTHSGGFTTMISMAREKANKHFNIYTYDIQHVDHIDEISKIYNFNVIKSCVFKAIQNDSITDSIFNKSRKVIFVDGGNKKIEFNLLAKYLLPGDIIAAHDYCKDSKIYEENLKNKKVWQWMEVQESDVIDTINAYNLVNLPSNLSEKFEDVAWLIKAKQ
jgi:23S rRNA U2552 (ribose-2'-O)-methylase RlmE/FtsJ